MSTFSTKDISIVKNDTEIIHFNKILNQFL